MDGNGINLCSVYPANKPYIYVHYNLKLPDVYVGLLAGYTEQRLIPFPLPTVVLLTFLSNGHHGKFFSLIG